jgi:hypothetical protein
MNVAVDRYPLLSDMAAMVQEMERDVAVSEQNYQRISKGLIHVSEGKAHISHEVDCLMWIERIEKTAKRIANSNGKPIKTVSSPRSLLNHTGSRYTLTLLGEAVWDLCRSGIPMIELACPNSRYKGRYSTSVVPFVKDGELAHTEDMLVRFNPYIAVMLRACQRAMPVIKAPGDFNLDLSVARIRNKLDWIVRFVRRACRSSRFKLRESKRAKLEKKNLKSSCLYMATGFHQFSSLLVLRVDLYIRPTHKTREDVRIAEKCLRLYLRALAEDHIVPDVKRWICKRECGFDRGIHYHLLVAMDGHKHQSASAFSRMLGEAWVKRCGPLRASYFNCYVRRHLFKYNALGSVHISDQRMLMGIKEAIRYMVKGDGFVMTGHKRNLWRGNMPSAWQQPKRGAPRKACNDMSLVNEILGDVEM